MTESFANHVVLFGGAFNPPHLGHIDALADLAQATGTRKMMVLPTFGNPLKPATTEFNHRFEMAKLNFGKITNETIEVSRFEADQKTGSTFDLLSRAKLLAHGHAIAFAMGTDQLETLRAWVKFPNFLPLADWIVILRKPKTLAACGPVLQSFETDGILKPTRDPFTFDVCVGEKKRTLKIITTEAMDISSSKIREQIALGKKNEIKNFLKPEVLEYIERNRLYGT